MKTKRILTIISAVSLALVIQSCSLVKNNDFAQRKYTKFKKSEDKVQLVNTNIAKKEIKENNAVVSKSMPSHEEMTINLPIVSDNNSLETPVTTVNEKPAVASNVKSLAKKVVTKSLVTFAKRMSNDFTGKNNTTSVSSDDQLLLLILAILLPPLAVYLVAGLGTEFWIDILLCLLFWLPGIIYAIIVVMR